MPALIVENGPLKGRRFDLQEGCRVVFGRDPRAQIRVDEQLCSRRHFVVEGSRGEFRIRDLDSKNGTFVNDEAVQNCLLQNGDSIRAGEVQMTFLDDVAGGGRGLIGKELRGYRLLERIGRGGMGTVYRAMQVSLKRQVAIKILSGKYAKDPDFVRKFEHEAQAAGRLNHPNVVQVYDVGSDRDLHFYSMEFIENGSAQDLVNRDGALDPELALAIITDAARGLAYAERKALVHRDIKPDNLMINADGVVKIADLGLAHDARQLSGEPRGSSADGIFGTPHFIAPEQARGEPVDTRSDLYSLGATGYMLLTGETPFHGDNVREIIQQQLSKPAPNVREKASSCPLSLAQIIERLLKKDPVERFQSAQELLTALEELGQKPPASRHMLVLSLLGLLLLAGGGGLFFILQGEDQTHPPPPFHPKNLPSAAEIARQKTAQAALKRQRIEAEAKNALLTLKLQESHLSGSGRTLEALKKLALAYRSQVLEPYKETTIRGKAEAELKRLQGEIQGLLTARATAQRRALKLKQAAQKLVASAQKNASQAAAQHHFCAALKGLAAALKEPALEGRPEKKALEEKEKLLLAGARAFVTDALRKGRQLEAQGRFQEAISALDESQRRFVADCQPREAPGPVQELVSKLSKTSREVRRAWQVRQESDLDQDQKTGFLGRQKIFLELRRGFDPARAQKQFEALKKKLKTQAWRRILEGDLKDVAALLRVEERLLEALKGRLGQKIRLPSSTDPRRGVKYTLVSVSQNGFKARTARSRPEKIFHLGDFPASEIKRWLVDAFLSPLPEDDADLVVFLLQAGLADQAQELLLALPHSLPGRAALLKRVQREQAAQAILREIRRKEPLAGREPAMNLSLRQGIETLIKKFSDTLVFLLNSDGSTYLVPRPLSKL